MTAHRIEIDAGDAGRGLGQLVVAVLQVLHELLERQAIRRVDDGNLTASQIEQLGRTLHDMRDRLLDLQRSFAAPAPTEKEVV